MRTMSIHVPRRRRHKISYKDKHGKHRWTNVQGNNCIGEQMSGVVNHKISYKDKHRKHGWTNIRGNNCIGEWMSAPCKITGERMSTWTKYITNRSMSITVILQLHETTNFLLPTQRQNTTWTHSKMHKSCLCHLLKCVHLGHP